MQKRSRSAQSMIEYVMIFVITLAAIIFGGPFLINSIGARLQGMDDAAQDSFNEDLRQAPAPACSCSPLSPDDKPWPLFSNDCHVNGCDFLSKSHVRVCSGSGPGCVTSYYCAQDSGCCHNPYQVGCGTVTPGGPSFCPQREVKDTVMTTFLGPSVDGRCLDSNGSVLGCLRTEKLYTTLCGGGLRRYACLPDSTCSGNGSPGGGVGPGGPGSGSTSSER